MTSLELAVNGVEKFSYSSGPAISCLFTTAKVSVENKDSR